MRKVTLSVIGGAIAVHADGVFLVDGDARHSG
jgi:hypothetical protein